VRQAARLRLAALVDPAIGVLQAALKQRKRLDLALSAARDALDRNGFKTPEKLELSGAVTVLDPAQVKQLSDDELQRAIDLARRLAAAGSGSEAAGGTQD
jgi:hypothetical protein